MPLLHIAVFQLYEDLTRAFGTGSISNSLLKIKFYFTATNKIGLMHDAETSRVKAILISFLMALAIQTN